MATSTVAGMSSRIRSDFGPLGGRTAGPRPIPGRHIDVHDGTNWRPGLFARWERAGTSWLGLVAWVTADGTVEVSLLPADQLRPSAGPASPPRSAS